MGDTKQSTSTNASTATIVFHVEVKIDQRRNTVGVFTSLEESASGLLVFMLVRGLTHCYSKDIKDPHSRGEVTFEHCLDVIKNKPGWVQFVNTEAPRHNSAPYRVFVTERQLNKVYY
jgi:hypothetical protein